MTLARGTTIARVAMDASTDVIARIRTWFEAHDPEVLAAVEDVDRTLIRSTLALPPFERLNRAVNTARSWARFHPVGAPSEADR